MCVICLHTGRKARSSLLHSRAKHSAIRLGSFQVKHMGILMSKGLGKKLHFLCNLISDTLQMSEVVLCPAQGAGITTLKDKIWLGLHAMGNAMATWRETSNTAGHGFPALVSAEASLHDVQLPKGVGQRSLCSLFLWSFSLQLVIKDCNILPSYKMQGLGCLGKTSSLAGPNCQTGGCCRLATCCPCN